MRAVTPDDSQRDLETTGRTAYDFDFGDIVRFHVLIVFRDAGMILRLRQV